MIELSLLGSPELQRSGESLSGLLVQPRRLALLAYLAVAPGKFQRRDRLLLLFWGDQAESRARASLRQALYFIRQSLGDEILVTRGADEVGVAHSAIRVDVLEFDRAIAEGTPAVAVSLYRGDFLADFNIDQAPEFERWAAEKRRGLRRAAIDAAWMLCDAAAADRSPRSTIQFAQRAVQISEYAESEVRRAMRTIAGTGDSAAALEMYEAFRSNVQDDLDAIPEAATTAIAAELRAKMRATAGAMPLAAPVAGEPAASEPPVPTASIPASASSAMGTARTRTLRNTMIGVAALGLCMLAWLVVRRVERVPVHSDTGMARRVAVLPFTIRSRATQSGYLRNGAATLLSLALDGAGELHVIDPNAVFSAAPRNVDLDAGRRISASLGAGHFVLGEIEAVESRLNITATLYDASGDTQVRATATGDEGRVFDLVDSLARRLAVGAVTDSTVRLAGVAATSTHSLAAFKSFLVGETEMRAGHYRQAAAALEEAVSADSAFGLAYYRLALAREWTDGEMSSDSAAALAEHFAARLPVRDRKLLAARRAFVRRDEVEGERLTHEVLAAYPTDADAWAQLGEIRFHIGPNMARSIDEARVPFIAVLRYRPNDLAARVHLTRIAAHSGDAAALDEWSGTSAWANDASEVGPYELAAMRAVVLGDPRARAAVVAATSRADEQTLVATVWRLGLYSGDPDGTAGIAALRRSDGSQGVPDAVTIAVDVARGHLGLVRMKDVESTRQRAVIIALMLAMPTSPDLPAIARETHDGLAGATSGAMTRIASSATVAARLLEARYPQLSPVVAHETALGAEETRTIVAIANAIRILGTNPARALEMVSADHLDESIVFHYGLYDVIASIRGEALQRLGRPDEAMAWVGSIGMNMGGASSVIPVAVRRLAEMEDARGAHSAASRDRARFAKMWHSCDPELQPLLDHGPVQQHNGDHASDN